MNCDLGVYCWREKLAAPNGKSKGVFACATVQARPRNVLAVGWETEYSPSVVRQSLPGQQVTLDSVLPPPHPTPPPTRVKGSHSLNEVKKVKNTVTNTWGVGAKLAFYQR